MKRHKALSPAERVDYSKYYDLLMKRRGELLDIDHRDEREIDQRQTTGEAPGDLGDGSVIDTNSDYFLQLADRDRQELIDIRDALEKMHHGTYGVCENCKKRIDPERLNRMPHARLCMSCQSARESRERVYRLHPTPKL